MEDVSAAAAAAAASRNRKRVFEGRSLAAESKWRWIHSLGAVSLWLGCVHLNFLLAFITIFFLPLSKALLVVGFLLILVLIPVDEESNFGRLVARYICRNGCIYFPITLHVEDMDAFKPSRAYIFGYEPHGILPIGAVSLADVTGFMPLKRVKVIASTAVFYVPFVRHVWSWMGLTPATKKNFISHLEAGNSCILVPGGVQETFLMEPTSEIVFLKKRQGFIRIAMETGTPLVPVFCFGQSSAFKWWKPGGKLFFRFVRAIKFTPIVFWGVFGTPLPFRHPIHTVVGKPIEVKKNPNPTSEEVLELHRKFVESMEDIFARYKVQLGYDKPLKVL